MGLPARTLSSLASVMPQPYPSLCWLAAPTPPVEAARKDKRSGADRVLSRGNTAVARAVSKGTYVLRGGVCFILRKGPGQANTRNRMRSSCFSRKGKGWGISNACACSSSCALVMMVCHVLPPGDTTSEILLYSTVRTIYFCEGKKSGNGGK